MKTNLKKLIKFDFIKKRKLPENLKHGLAIFFLIGIIFTGLYGTRVRADNPTEFAGQGFAYGSINDGGSPAADTGIGYISFGCESDGSCVQAGNYGVRINTDPNSSDEGKFFGYAWSSNYGWISFNHNDVQSCGANGGLEINGDVQAFIANNTVQSQVLQGFAKVLNAGGGWDGCINFSGMTQMNTTFQTTITKQMSGEITLDGLAWGSPVIGWIDFDCPYCGVEFIPNDALEEIPEVCPPGTTGTPPNCDVCPPGSTDPNCNPPVCPPGTTGTPPNCCPISGQGSGGTIGQNCQPSARSNILLHVGEEGAPQNQIIGNTTYNITIEDLDQAEQVTLIPQALGLGVHSCSASSSSSLGNGGASVDGWTGTLTSLDSSFPTPFLANDLSHEFDVSISDYSNGEVITLRIDCLSTTTNIPLFAEVFIIVGTVPAIVSIDADPTYINEDLTEVGVDGLTTLSWNFSNVQVNSCSITGEFDSTPSQGDDPLIPVGVEFDFESPSPNSSGTDDLENVIYPVAFTITCDDYLNNPVSDIVYITTPDYGCTASMEEEGYCDNDINPIFEEF